MNERIIRNKMKKVDEEMIIQIQIAVSEWQRKKKKNKQKKNPKSILFDKFAPEIFFGTKAEYLDCGFEDVKAQKAKFDIL